MMWDVFISHASEDKDDFVRPLAVGLQNSGVSVWYDEFTLRLGDSLRRSIDHGLSQSRFGVVVLSVAFFDKPWTQLELDGLVARDVRKGSLILPIWHKVEKEDVVSYSPTLADRIAVKSSRGLLYVISKIIEVVKPIRVREEVRKDQVGDVDWRRPRVFIGSSVEGVAVAYAAQQEITDIAEPVVWSNSIIGLSEQGIDDLLKELDTCEYAVLVCTSDVLQAAEFRQSFVSGTVVGKLGRDNVLFLLEGERPVGLPFRFGTGEPIVGYFRKASPVEALVAVRSLIRRPFTLR